MSANIIDSFFVALGFKIDDGDLTRFKGEVNKARESILGLRDVIGGFITGGVAMLAKSFVDTSAKFEDFETILSGLEGSAEKGKAAMEWVSAFAAKTPYELDGVTDAFVKLKAYGMDPIANGLLTTLGDTSAAMKKPLMSAVEAIADAITGENERLKEFGIKAKKTGDKITYEYTQNGQTMTKSASASNRAQIQSTLQAIWNEKYAGSMDRLSKTWNGMWSNLKDSVTRFKKYVMDDSGIFGAMKESLAKLLERINKAFDNGQVKRFGQWVGIVFATIAKAGTIAAEVIDWLVEGTVGWEVALSALAAVLAGGFAAAIANTTKLMFGLARGVFAVNLAAAGWVLLIGAIVAGIALIVDDYQNWKEGNESLIGSLSKDFPWIIDAIHAIEKGFAAVAEFGQRLWAMLSPSLGELGRALWTLVSTVAQALWPVIKFLFTMWANYLQWILPYIVLIIEGLATGLVGAINMVIQIFTMLAQTATVVFNSILNAIVGVKDYLSGFIDSITGAIGKVKELVGLGGGDVKVAGAIAQAPALGALGSPTASGTPSLAGGGVLGKGNDVLNSQQSQVTTNQTSIQAPITVVSPDPTKAGEAVKDTLDRLNKQTTRNGQTAVAL